MIALQLALALSLTLPLTLGLPSPIEACREIHGSANFYTGDGQTRIWHIGTHQDFAISDQDSYQLLLRYIPEDGSKTLYGDFTVCPAEKYVQGAAQPVVLKKVRHPVVMPWFR